jgi:superfamily II DNA helicase RecQ
MNGFDSKSYHAGLTGTERQQRQKNFINNKVRIIVATVAFGMGINKPDVSAVMHFSLPRSLEGSKLFI